MDPELRKGIRVGNPKHKLKKKKERKGEEGGNLKINTQLEKNRRANDQEKTTHKEGEREGPKDTPSQRSRKTKKLINTTRKRSRGKKRAIKDRNPTTRTSEMGQEGNCREKKKGSTEARR